MTGAPGAGLRSASLGRLVVAVGDGAEGFGRVGHERLDLLHGSRDAGQQLHAVRRHSDVVLDANLRATAGFQWSHVTSVTAAQDVKSSGEGALPQPEASRGHEWFETVMARLATRGQ